MFCKLFFEGEKIKPFIEQFDLIIFFIFVKNYIIRGALVIDA